MSSPVPSGRLAHVRTQKDQNLLLLLDSLLPSPPVNHHPLQIPKENTSPSLKDAWVLLGGEEGRKCVLLPALLPQYPPFIGPIAPSCPGRAAWPANQSMGVIRVGSFQMKNMYKKRKNTIAMQSWVNASWTNWIILLHALQHLLI